MRQILRRAIGSSISASLLLIPVALTAQARDSVTFEKCDKPYGSLAVVEPENEIVVALQRFTLGSPTALIRKMVQESNCFVVVDRGPAMRTLMQERDLASSGALQQGSDIGDGQLKVADFALTPTVTFSEPNAGGVGSIAAGIGAHAIGLGGFGVGVKTKEAGTTMSITDTRSGVQVAAADGNAKKTDFSIGALGWGGDGLGALGGYTNTSQGKVVAASFLDNFNNLVVELRKKNLKPAADGPAGGSGNNVKAGPVFKEGELVHPKIDVKLFAEPNEAAKVIATLSKADELVFLGDDKDGFIHVQGSAGEGWLKKILIAKGGASQAAGRATSSASGPAAPIPDVFIGDWKGTMRRPGLLSLAGAETVGFHVAATGSNGYTTSLNCTGDLAYMQGNEKHVLFRWNTTSGRCVGLVVEFISASEDRLEVRVHPPGDGQSADARVLLSGTLTKG